MLLLLWNEDYNESNERDDLMVEATARYNPKCSVWEAEFDWDNVKNQSEINEKGTKTSRQK